jgi:integrase
MGKRRSRGEGSVYKRKDGSWCAQYSHGSKKKYLYAKTKKAVTDRLREQMNAIHTGDLVEIEPVTIDEYLDRWLASVEGTVRDRTLQRYEGLVRNHINPEIGGMMLGSLTPSDIQGLYQKKLKGGLSPRSVEYIHITINKAISQAVLWQMVNRNVAATVKPPKPLKKEIQVLCAEEVKRFLETAEGDRYWALFVLGITTGMRAGELLGLKWLDVDFGKNRLHVRRTLWRGKTYPPKTKKGYRTIPLPSMSVEALMFQRLKTEAEWVFPTGKGTCVNYSNLVRRSFKPLLERAGLPDMPFHSATRHTCATLLLSEGVHPKLVQEMLGHATISITLDLYSHVTPMMQERTAQAMEEALM